MSSKKEFEKCKEYYLKYINSEEFKSKQEVIHQEQLQDFADDIKEHPELKNRTDFYGNFRITQITICDVLSNNGLTTLLKKIYSLPSKSFKTDIMYKKPSLLHKYDYIHLLYSHSHYGVLANIKFLDNNYIDSINITWAQINSFYAVIEYTFSLKKWLSPKESTFFVCENISKLNSKDYLPVYNISSNMKLNIDTIEEMDYDFFESIFQHYITSLFYSENGKTSKLTCMIHSTRNAAFDIDKLDLQHYGVSYYNKKENYLISASQGDSYCLLAGNNCSPYFNLTNYICKYGNNFYYMFFGYKELKQLELEFSKYSTGRKKVKYDKSYIALLNKSQSMLDTRRTSKADIFKAFNKNWELYYGYEKKALTKK